MKVSRKLLLSLSTAAIVVFALTCTVSATSEKTGIVTGTVVNFRQKPDLSSKVLFQLNRGTRVTVTGSEGEWYKVMYNDASGWMHDDYVIVRDDSIEAGIVTGSVVNVRSRPDINSEVLTQYEKGTKVDIFEHSGDWYRVAIGEQRYGWMHSDYVSIRKETVSRGSTEQDRKDTDVPEQGTADESSAEEISADTDSLDAGSADEADLDTVVEEDDTEISDQAATEASEEDLLRQQIVDYAKTLIGIKYVYGGESTKGFDCSGFVQYVYNHFDISIERTSKLQSRGGASVKKADLKPGDLVFFDTVEDGTLNDISHVGIYIGGGNFIHASTYLKKSIATESLSSSYYKKRYMKARDYISK